MRITYTGERGYLALLHDVLTQGVDIKNERTGHFCRTIFEANFTVPEGESFLVTHRPAALRLAFEEMWFFLRGQMDTSILEDKGCKFWTGNTTREFLDKRGLTALPEKHLGKAYSMQWRNSGGDFAPNPYYTDYDYNGLDGTGEDQLQNLVNGLRNDPFGRRHMVMLWNPLQSDEMCLTPCWYGSQYVVLPDRDGNKVLHVKLLNRSLDVPFGMLFAVQQYRLFQQALCHMLGFKLGKLSCDITNPHVYDNQLEYAKEIVERPLGRNGVVSFNKELNNLEDLLELEWKDINVSGHVVIITPFETPRPVMVA